MDRRRRRKRTRRRRIGETGSLVVDANFNVYFADISNALVRKIDPTGNVSPFAGSGETGKSTTEYPRRKS